VKSEEATDGDEDDESEVDKETADEVNKVGDGTTAGTETLCESERVDTGRNS